MITLYDLAGADPAIRFSPYCWRVRMALAHKGLAVETIPWRFCEKDAIAFAGQDRVPVLIDEDDRVVVESWDIACYLDTAYPQTPALFDSAGAMAHARFMARWSEQVLQPAIVRQILTDIFTLIDERDRPYFRTSREKAFGMSLEAVVGDADAQLPALRNLLAPLRKTLGDQVFLGGADPSFADYIVFGAFQWARVCSARPLLAPDDPILAWRGRMLGLFGGLAAAMPARRPAA